MADKVKFVVEYQLHSTPKVLFNMLSTPAGLAEWFADDVSVENFKSFIFKWEDNVQYARLTAIKDLKFVRFKWLNEKWEDENNDHSYFEFKIVIDELTGDLALVITDFAFEDEKKDAIKLWDKQIAQLKRVSGA